MNQSEKIKRIAKTKTFIECGDWQDVNREKLNDKDARDALYLLWEAGLVPSNFTEDHSFYADALDEMKKNGHIEFCHYFSSSRM